MKHLLLELKSEMEKLLVKYALLKQEQFDRLFEGVDSLGNEAMEKLWDSLQRFRTEEYQELYRIFRLPLDNSPNGEEYWERILLKRPTSYSSQFPEVQLFRKQARLCREVWRLLIKENCPHAKKTKDSVDDGDPQGAQSLSV